MMKAMFYRCPKSGKWNRDIYGRAIGWWTRTRAKWAKQPVPKVVYTHVELVFSDGVSYSARQDGVSFAAIDYRKHPERWTAIALPMVTPQQEEMMRAHAYTHVNEKYDWLGIVLDRVFGTGIHKADSWWCSEIVMHILGLEPQECDPTECYEYVWRWREAA